MKSLILLLPFLIGIHQASALEAHRPMSEMHGGCGNYQWDLKTEFATWKHEPQKMNATAAPSSSGEGGASLGQRLEITLLPEKEVHFAVPPTKKKMGMGDTGPKYAGFVGFKIPKDGAYRISAGGRPWFEVLEGSKAVESTGFEMQTECDTITKSVLFNLKAGKNYQIQISSSPKDHAALLVSSVAK